MGCRSMNAVFVFLKIVFFANSADPDLMPLYVAIRLGIHCPPKYLFTGIQNYINVENMESLSYEYFP